jgi:hypothetical protein
MPNKYSILKTRTNRAGFDQLAKLHAAAEDLFFDTLEVDFSQCSWFDANMTAALGAVVTRITDALNDVTIVGASAGIQQILSKNDFLKAYGFPSVLDSHGTVVPYRRFQLSEDRYFTEYVQKFTQAKGIPTMSTMLRRKFLEGIMELFSNAMLHSQSQLGVFSCGQYYPQRKSFDFCIADAGEGFVGAIYKAFGMKVDSLKAMRFCTSKNNTTKQIEPGGLGLKLLKRFIELNQGRIVIVSNQAYYEFTNSGEKYENLEHPFPGTCVNIEIDTADTKNYRLSTEPLKTT